MVIHGKQLFVNYLFVKQFTYYFFSLTLQSKQTTMKIRLEQPSDYREVEVLTREAFWNVYRPGCYEHFVLNQFRSNPDFIPELDLVMEEDGMIIGHIMFSKAELILDDGTRCPSWTFGPISIHPDYQRKEYGLKLLNYALDKAREMGIGFLCMEGNINFYKHAGFGLASKMGIHYHAEPRDAEVPYFLAQELIPGWLKNNGIRRPPIARQRVISLPKPIQRPLPPSRPSSLLKRKPCFLASCHNFARAAACHSPRTRTAAPMPMAASALTTANTATKMASSCKTAQWTR